MRPQLSIVFNDSTGRPTGLSRSALLGIGLLSIGALLTEHGFVVKEFKAVPMPEDVIQAEDVLALAGSVLDLARFVGDDS